jgi:hypothetical protein
MTDLSPAGRAVSNAAKSSLDWEAGYLPNAVAAAALRAAAVYCTRERRILMTIAAELEAL